MAINRSIKFLPLCAVLLAAMTRVHSHAQAPPPQNPPPAQDPLITLMSSQPRIDLDSPVKASSAFDPPAIKPGQTSILRVTINAIEASIDWPALTNFPPGLTGKPSAHGQILQTGPGVLIPFTTFNTRVYASQAGNFTIPPFTFKAYGKTVQAPAATLVVADTMPPGTGTPLVIETGKTNLFVGQSFPVRVMLPSSQPGVVQSLGQVEINGKGLFSDQGLAQQRFETRMVGPVNLPVFVHEANVTPLRPGTMTLFAQGYSSAHHFSGPVLISPAGPGTFPGLQTALLESEEKQIQVRPLPVEGKLPGFKGAIGRFYTDPPILSTNEALAGEPIKLIITFHGDGNLARLSPPEPPRTKSWQITAPRAENDNPQLTQMRRAATFFYTLVPLDPKLDRTPEFPFSYFDPEKARYVNLTIPSIPIIVHPSPNAMTSMATADSRDEQEPIERVPKLHEAADKQGKTFASLPPQQKIGFYLLQLIPALFFGALLLWDRNRRFLEMHPEVLVRRRARKALRIQRGRMETAARENDEPAFASAAIGALRVACAPHLLAEPNALAASDIFEVLPNDVQQPGHKHLVWRFFAVMNTTRYSREQTELKPLISEKAALEAILDHLAGRL